MPLSNHHPFYSQELSLKTFFKLVRSPRPKTLQWQQPLRDPWQLFSLWSDKCQISLQNYGHLSLASFFCCLSSILNSKLFPVLSPCSTFNGRKGCPAEFWLQPSWLWSFSQVEKKNHWPRGKDPASRQVCGPKLSQSSAIDISPGRVIMAIIFIIACLVSYLNIPAGVGFFFFAGSFEHFEQFLMLSSSGINIQRGQGMWNCAGIWMADLAAHKFALSQDVKSELNCQKCWIDWISLNRIDLNSITLLKTRISSAAASV